jgi:hypothetical protein
VAGDEDDLVVDELVGDGHGLLRVAGVVADLEDELLAVDAALGVDVLHRHLGAALHLLAEDGVLAGHRAGGRDHHVGLGRSTRRHERRGAEEHAGQRAAHRMVPHLDIAQEARESMAAMTSSCLRWAN